MSRDTSQSNESTNQSLENNETGPPQDFILNWDVIGLTSVAITLVGAAIFYIAGWMYEAHWFSYYGIDISQLSLSPFQIMIEGVPGILLLTISLLTSFLFISIFNRVRGVDTLRRDYLPIIITLAFFIAFALMIVGAIIVRKVTDDPVPIMVSVMIIPGFIIILIIYTQLYSISTAFLFRKLNVILFRRFKIDAARGVTLLTRKQNRISQFIRYMYGLESEFKLGGLFLNSFILWQFLFGIVAILFFLTSISASALLGSYDARRGVRLLSGDWRIRKTYLYSNEELEALSSSTNISNSGFVYGPLGMLMSNERDFFLVDWKESLYYEEQPKVYIIPREKVEQIVSEPPIPPPTPEPTLPPTPEQIHSEPTTTIPTITIDTQ